MVKIGNKFILPALVIGLLSVSGCIQEKPADRLDEAIRSGNIAKVKQLLDQGVPAEPRRRVWTPLMVAVVRDKPKIADLLLEYGANIHSRTKRGQTPLHLAARWGGKRMVKYLLKKGAGTEKRDWLSWTPLMWASLMGKNNAVKTLLDGGAYIHTRDIDYNTPLILAAWRGHTDTAMILINHGANIFSVNNEGLDAAAIAKKHEFPKLAKKLEDMKK